ncbi:MAG: glycosyltransferase [Anaerolineales bacterium]
MENQHFHGGVGGKIVSQMHIWQERGHSARLFVPSPDHFQADDIDVFPYTTNVKLPVLKSISRIMARSKAASRLVDAVRRFKPDLIYLRYGRYTWPLDRIAHIAPMVVEINSDDLNESRLYGRFLYWSNRFTRSIFLKKAAGLIAVSHEIGELPANKQYSIPICVVSNGIDLEQYTPLLAPKNETPAITLVGKPNLWHGIEKLVPLAERYPDLTINIVGYTAQEFTDPVPSNFHLLGFLHRDQVKEVLRVSDAAFGTLALHRKQMEEASPLKVREAAAHGIPLILGYQDTDLSDIRSDCILQIPNTEDNVERYAEQIHEFAYNMRGRRLGSDVAAIIDQKRKEDIRLAFFEQIVRNAHKGS